MNRTLRNRVAFLTVLAHRDYRRYYLGLLASVSAHQGKIALQGFLVYELTGLEAALGFVAAAQAVPAIALNLVAGALADRIDPRRMIIFGQGTAAVLMAVMGMLVFTDVVQMWHVIVVAFLTGIAISFDQPARRAIWPVLIPREKMLYATSMNQGVWNGTRVIAPAVALGIVPIGQALTGDLFFGIAISFWVLAVGFFSMVVAMLLISFPNVPRSQGDTVLRDIIDGLAFTYRNRIFLVLLAMSFAIGYFGLSYMWLMPAFAKDVLDVGPESLGLLMSATGAGGLIGVFGVASFGGYQNRVWLLIGGAVSFGAVVILFAATGPLMIFGLAMVLAGLGGGLYSLFQVAANTVLNLLVPHEYRGRVMGLRGITWSLAPLGALQSGLIATWFGTPLAVAVGGAVVIVFALGVLAMSKDVRNLRRLVEQAHQVQWERPDGPTETPVSSQRPA